MSANLDMVFCDIEDLYLRFKLSKLIEIINDIGYQAVNLINFSTKEVLLNVIDLDSKNDIDKLNNKNIKFTAINKKESINYSFYIGQGIDLFNKTNRMCIIASTLDTYALWKPEHNPEKYSEIILTLAIKLQEYIRSTYGFIDLDFGMDAPFDDLEKNNISKIYWTNIFGKTLVTKLGKELLLSAPSWRTQYLSDGSIIYIIGSSPGIAKEHVDIEKIKTHFKVSTVR